MSVYFIVSYDIENPELYAGYVPAVVPLIEEHNGEIVVADYDTQSIEGDKRGVYVVLRFDSEEAAMGWYNDPAYAPVKQIRLDATSNGTAVLAAQFVPPT